MSSSSHNAVARVFARHVVQSRYEAVPASVRSEARRSFLNWIACALGGCATDAVERTLQVVRPLSGAPAAGVVGRAERLDAVHACLINGMSAYVLDYDDAHDGERIVLHPGGAVGPAALALAEAQRANGAELLHAFILGTDVMCRVGNAVYDSDNVGWYPTANVAGIGAACAAAKLLRMSEARTATAIGTAAALSAGMRCAHGSMMKSFSPAHGASTGVLAALLAQADVTGPQHALEAPDVGFAHLMGSPARLDAAVDALGERYEISRNTYKPYPCAIGLHAAITACLELRAADPYRSGIASVEARVTPRAARVNALPHPATMLQARISLPHAIAIALVHGAAGEAQYSAAAVDDAALAAVRACVCIVPDEALAKDEAEVAVVLRDGRRLGSGVVRAIGGAARPMSDEDLDRKLRELAARTLPSAQTEALIVACRRVDMLPDLGPLFSLLRGDPGLPQASAPRTTPQPVR